MIIVVYAASGMKWITREDVTRKDFWDFFRSKKAAVAREIEEEELEEGTLTIWSEAPRMAFEVVDERLASGCTRYVARPDNWPINNGEPT